MHAYHFTRVALVDSSLMQCKCIFTLPHFFKCSLQQSGKMPYDVMFHHTPQPAMVCFFFSLIVQDSPWRYKFQTAAATNILIIAFVTSISFASCFWTTVKMLEGILINTMNINSINTNRMMPMQLEFYNRWMSLCRTEQLQLSWSSGSWKRLSTVQLFLVGFYC